MFRLLAFLSLCCLGVVANAEPMATGPNILFIAVDDLKPVLGCYGDKVAITPEMDRLAKRGTVFLNAHCQWPVCGPSRASLMTGLRPEASGVMDLKTSMRAKNPDVLTLPQHFKNNGYATAGVGKIYDPRCVDDRKTLDEPSWSLPFVKPKVPVKLNKEKRFALAPDIADEELTDGLIAVNGMKLMRKLSKADEPFFLAVGFKKPHLPFVAPKKYWDLYPRDRFKLAAHRGGIENASGYSIHNGKEFRGYSGIPKEGDIADEIQIEAIHGYYACTSFIDAQVGLLLDELDRLDLTKNTIIVLWGDHGFHLGDHQMWGKHSTLEHAARVPLVICPIAGTSGTATGKTNSPVELTDIFPTLCDYAAIETPTPITGRSLVPLIDGTQQRIRGGALTVFKSNGCTGYSYRTERYRLTQWVHNKKIKVMTRELYDYKTDPLETKNLAEDPNHADLCHQIAELLRSDSQGCYRLLASQPDAN